MSSLNLKDMIKKTGRFWHRILLNESFYILTSTKYPMVLLFLVIHSITFCFPISTSFGLNFSYTQLNYLLDILLYLRTMRPPLLDYEVIWLYKDGKNVLPFLPPSTLRNSDVSGTLLNYNSSFKCHRYFASNVHIEELYLYK